MSYQDRHYNRDSSRGGSGEWRGGGDAATRILRWLNASFPIGTVFGIRVSVHITFVLLIIFELIRSSDWIWTLRWIGLLFVSVLLHEFGHCFGCRSVGGQADRILMWPLGGLAYCQPPHRPWPEFVTIACGPLVNVVLAGASYLALLLSFGGDMPVSLNPFHMYVGFRLPDTALWAFIADLFAVNYGLLLFNVLLVFYPFDGGRLLQIALWTRMGYSKSMRIATAFGMAGAVLVAVVGLAWNNSLLLLIAIFGFITCYQQRQQLAAIGDFDHGEDFDVGQSTWNRPAKKGWLARWRDARTQRAARKQSQRQSTMERRIDEILSKVHQHGLASLTPAERRVLQDDTDRKRRTTR